MKKCKTSAHFLLTRVGTEMNIRNSITERFGPPPLDGGRACAEGGRVRRARGEWKIITAGRGAAIRYTSQSVTNCC